MVYYGGDPPVNPPDYYYEEPQPRHSKHLRKRIKVAYEVITPESSQTGEAAEQGWENEEGEIVHSAKEAIDYLKKQGALECEDYGNHIICRTLDPERDMDNYDEEKYYQYVVEGFSSRQLEKIFNAVDFGSGIKRRR